MAIEAQTHARPLVKASLHEIAKFIRGRLGSELSQYVLFFHCKLSTLLQPDRLSRRLRASLDTAELSRVPYQGSVGLAVCRRAMTGKVPLLALDVVTEATEDKKQVFAHVGMPYFVVHPSAIPEAGISNALTSHCAGDPPWIEHANRRITPSEQRVYDALAQFLPTVGAVYLSEVALSDMAATDWGRHIRRHSDPRAPGDHAGEVHTSSTPEVGTRDPQQAGHTTG